MAKSHKIAAKQRNGQRATSCKFNYASRTNRKYNMASERSLDCVYFSACWMSLLQVFRPETNCLRQSYVQKRYVAYR